MKLVDLIPWIMTALAFGRWHKNSAVNVVGVDSESVDDKTLLISPRRAPSTSLMRAGT